MPSDKIVGDAGELNHIGPYERNGHAVEARVYSGNVSADGPAIVSNALWLVSIDSNQCTDAGESSSDDTEESVKPRINLAVDEYLRSKEQQPQ